MMEQSELLSFSLKVCLSFEFLLDTNLTYTQTKLTKLNQRDLVLSTWYSSRKQRACLL